MKETHNPYNNLPSDDEMGYIDRKQRDADVFRSFEFKSNEEIIAVCREALEAEQQAKLLALLRNENTLSVEKFLNSKLVNKNQCGWR